MKNAGQSSFITAMEESATEAVGIPASVLSVATRQELRELARRLRAAADSIDALIEQKPKKAADANGQPTFRFAAKVSLPDDFRLTKKLHAYALELGFSESRVSALHENFVSYYRKSGKKWQDWGRTWMDWCRRQKERDATAPRQRVSSGQLDRW